MTLKNNKFTRRLFLFALSAVLALVAQISLAQIKGPLGGSDTAQTLEALKKSATFVVKWTEAEFEGRKYVFGVGDDLGDGESYIDLHGWIYHQHFLEWRRIFLVRTRGLYGVEFRVDRVTGVVSAHQTAETSNLKRIEAFRFDLRATGDDAKVKR